MTDRTKLIDGIPVGLTDQDGTDSRFSVDVNITSGSITSPGITQYTEGDIDASITGTAVMWEDAANTLRSVSAAKPLPVSMQTPLDSAAFTPTTDPYMPVGGEFDDAAPAGLAEGQGGAVRLSSRREMYITIRDAAGNERGLNIDSSGNLAVTVPGDYPEDSPHNNEDVGLFVLTVRNDSGSVMSGTDGDYTPFMVDANGRLYVKNDALDKDADEVLVWANTAKDGSGTDYVPLVDGDGHLQVDVLSAVVNSGSVDVLSLPADTFVAEDGALGKGVLVQGDDGTDRKNIQVNPDGDVQFHSNWAPSLQADEAANDSDKEFTVTGGKEWHVMWLWVEFTSSGSSGNRQVEVQLKDNADDVIVQLQAGATQAASLTRNYLFAPGMADLTAFRDTSYLMTPIPPTLILPASYDVRVWDNNAVDAAGDDMTLQMMVLERTA